MPQLIDGVKQRELFCLNNDCRKLLGYERIQEGVITLYCRKCQKWNTWKINYGKGRENIDTLIDRYEERG